MFLQVKGAGYGAVNGIYRSRPYAQIPDSFVCMCVHMGWDAPKLWKKLAGPNQDWFEHEHSSSYIYMHGTDGTWWMCGPDGSSSSPSSGIYIAPAHVGKIPPARGWSPLQGGATPLPTLEVVAAGVENGETATTTESVAMADDGDDDHNFYKQAHGRKERFCELDNAI
jgi:hypothetical protein